MQVIPTTQMTPQQNQTTITISMMKTHMMKTHMRLLMTMVMTTPHPLMMMTTMTTPTWEMLGNKLMLTISIPSQNEPEDEYDDDTHVLDSEHDKSVNEHEEEFSQATQDEVSQSEDTAPEDLGVANIPGVHAEQHTDQPCETPHHLTEHEYFLQADQEGWEQAIDDADGNQPQQIHCPK